MVDITILEINLPESTFSAALPFGSSDQPEGPSAESDNEPATEESSGKGKALAVVATFVFFVLAVALVKHLTGDEDHDVDIETPDEPIGVKIDDEDEE